MLRIGDNTFASIIFTITWQSPEALHRERFLARKANLWRDIFPPGLRASLENLAPGESISIEYSPGQAMPGRDESLIRTIPSSAFVGGTVAGRHIIPRLGRFYPRGLFPTLPGVYPQDMRPVRLLDSHSDCLVLDLNHPLAGTGFSLEAQVIEVAPKISDTGGRLSCWLEEIADFGPGMQMRRLGSLPTDFGGPEGLLRQDASSDALFYNSPRMVGHVDAQASSLLSSIYMERLKPGNAVLDLMSSVQSHVPVGAGLALTGLGLNAAEMAANPALSTQMVHDLNQDPYLPFPSGTFDAVLISLSIEYLAMPSVVLGECARVLAPGGRIMIGFSNRWFPTKAVACWPDLHEFERLGFVLDLLIRDGSYANVWSESVRNWWRPADDPHVRQTWTSDPVYVAGGTRV